MASCEEQEPSSAAALPVTEPQALTPHLEIKGCQFGFQGANSVCGGHSKQPEQQLFQKHSNHPIAPKECLNFFIHTPYLLELGGNKEKNKPLFFLGSY